MNISDAFKIFQLRVWGPVLVAAMAATMLANFASLALWIPATIDVSFPEGSIVARGYDVLRGENPYHDWRQWPHDFSPYTPLEFYVPGWIGRLWNPSMPPKSLYQVGRIFSFVSLLAAALAVGGIAQRICGSFIWAFTASSLWTFWYGVLHFSVSYRPDAPLVALSVLSIWIALSDRPSLVRLLIALFVLSLAMWFKPTAWGGVAVLGWWIWKKTDRRFFAFSSILFVGVNLGLAVLFNHLWEGRLFLNLFASGKQGLSFFQVWLFYRGVDFLPRIVILLGLALSLRWVFQSQTTDLLRALSFGFIISWVTATILDCKPLSGINYYFECWTLASILCVEAARRIRTGSHRFRTEIGDLAFSLIVGLLIMAQSIISIAEAGKLYPQQVKTWRPSSLASAIAAVEEEILVFPQNLALERPAPPTLMDFPVYTVFYRSGLIDDQPLIGRLEARVFRVVVLSADFIRDNPWLPPRFTPTLNRNYHETGRVGNLIVLEPNEG